MKLSSKSRYAVMAIVDMSYYCKEEILAGHHKPISLQQIAERQNIALNYLEQIFVKLRRGGIVNSVKGPGGGYILSKPLQEIKLADIIIKIDGSIKMTRCNLKAVGCIGKGAKCLTHHLWAGLEETISNYLNSISLLDVVKNLQSINQKRLETCNLERGI